LAFLFRSYVALFVFALVGVTMWAASVYFYKDFQAAVLKQKDLVSTILVKSWHLEWGAFAVITGFGVLLLIAVISLRK